MNFFEKIKENLTSSSSSAGQAQDWYVTVVRGEGIKDEHFYARSDPYLKIEFGGKNVKTRAVKHDRSPDWNETFHFQLKSEHAQSINLTLMDDKLGFDDAIGKASISRGDLPAFSEEEKRLEIPIFKNGQISGLIHLRVKLVDTNMPQQQQQQQQANQSSLQTGNIPNQQQSFQSSNLPYQQQQQQPSMSYDGLYTQPQNQGQNTQYPTNPVGQFQSDLDRSQQQNNMGQQQQQQPQPRSNDNYYGQQ